MLLNFVCEVVAGLVQIDIQNSSLFDESLLVPGWLTVVST